MMTNSACVLLVLFLGLWVGSADAQMTQKPEDGTFLLQNGTLIPVSSDSVQADLLIRGGKITAIGKDLEVSDDVQIIDCTGQFVYPGLIDGGTQLGLAEVGSISLTQDANELGDFAPHMHALTAVNPNSVLIPVTRVNGITSVLTKPSGGLFPGTAAFPGGSEFFITRKLWDVGNSAPYGHRGDLTTITEAILAHGGEARASRDQFTALDFDDQAAVVKFLKTLQVLPAGSPRILIEPD